MITGFNTDVQYEGRVYHVQTEDKGLDNPVVESLVYSGGEIVTSRRSTYGDIAGTAACTEAEILRRMESQHQTLVREILGGKFDPEGPKPFGYNIITNRSLDEVVLEFLGSTVGEEGIRLELGRHQNLVEGEPASMELRVVADSTDRPVAGAKVTIKLISTREKPRELFSGATGGDGRIEAVFDLPELQGASGAILCQADAAGRNAELKQLICKREAAES